MVVVYCDRCEAKLGKRPTKVGDGSNFKVPVFCERNQHLTEAVETHLCKTCAQELMNHLGNWWGKVLEFQEEWNRDVKASS